MKFLVTATAVLPLAGSAQAAENDAGPPAEAATQQDAAPDAGVAQVPAALEPSRGDTRVVPEAVAPKEDAGADAVTTTEAGNTSEPTSDATGAQPDAQPDEQPDEQPEEAAEEGDPPFDLHVGVNLRTDLGAHPIRFDLGMRWEMIDVALVVDPMVLTDGLLSTDLLLMWRTPIGVAPLVGWRVNAVGIIDGPQLQQNLLVGVAGDLPRFFGGWLRGQAGIEVAATLLRHGGGLPPETIGLSSGRSYIDLINFALFFRGELAVPLGGTW
jgi:hypothetical protein